MIEEIGFFHKQMYRWLVGQYTPKKEGIEALKKSIVNPVVKVCKCGSEDVYYNGRCMVCYFDQKF